MRHTMSEQTNFYYQNLQPNQTTDANSAPHQRCDWPISVNAWHDQSLPFTSQPKPLALAHTVPEAHRDSPALRLQSELAPPAAMPIRLLLVDDHPLLLDSLAFYLAQHAQLIIAGTLSHGDQCLGCIEAYSPDVVVMDLSMPGLGVYERLRQLQAPVAGYVQPAVLILTSDLGEYRLCELVEAGARGYLPKDSDGKQLVAAIIALAQGSLYLHGDFGVALGGRTPAASTPAKLASKADELKNDCQLSQREFQLLELMAEGCSNKEIAHRLFLSTGTIKSYSSRMFEKLSVDRKSVV